MKGNYFIYLAGNASVEGGSSYNQALSAKRCDAVKRYLEGIGISQRVLLLPYGSNSSVTAKQSKEADRAQNRRVDIYLSGEQYFAIILYNKCLQFGGIYYNTNFNNII